MRGTPSSYTLGLTCGTDPFDERHRTNGERLAPMTSARIWSSVFMRDESSCRSSSFDELRNAHVSQDLIVVVVAMRVCLHGENGLPIGRDDREHAIVEPS